MKSVSAMNKLYIGNLPIEADEAAVRQLFAEQNLTVADISVKRGGYAFVDFPDQSAADRAIDKLHGELLKYPLNILVYISQNKSLFLCVYIGKDVIAITTSRGYVL